MRFRTILSLTWLAAGVLAAALPAHADVPLETGYQGYLFDPNGLPVNGSADFEIAIFGTLDADPNDTVMLFYREEHLGVPIEDALFRLPIGGGTVLFGTYDPPLLTTVSDLELELTVNTEVLSPRQPILPTFYAQQCLLANSAATVGPGGVDSSALATGAVLPVHIAGNSIGADKILDGSLTGVDLSQNGSIVSGHIQNGTITAADIQTSTLTGTQIQNNSLTGSDIQDGSLTTSDIQNGSLTATDFQSASSFGTTISAVLTSVGAVENTLPLGTRSFCALIEMTCGESNLPTSTTQYCRVTRSGSAWTLRAFGGSLHTCSCRAACF